MKNFAALYLGGNDSSALNQSYFLKVETVRGQGVAPAGTDFFYTLSGGSIKFTQPKMSSPHRSGRHNNNIIQEKTATEWSLSTYINLKTSVAYGSSVDTAMKTLWKSALGRETDTTTALEYDAANDPSTTFTMLENLDHVAKQMVGGFVDQVEISLAGDGQSQVNWSGRAKYVYHAGIGKSTDDNNAGNVITLASPAEAKRFDVGAMVMIVEADGTTRSADTPTGTPRKVTAVDTTLGTVTVDGAVLADADGSVTPIYLCYYEPTGIVAIDEPQTGLVGSATISGLGGVTCIRSATLTIANNHEVVDYCYGTDRASGAIFVPAGRMEATLSLELNLNAALVEFMKSCRNFDGQAIELIVGNAAGRHFKMELPKVIFDVPEISVPESGSIPVTFSGTCLQTAYDAADEVVVSFN